MFTLTFTEPGGASKSHPLLDEKRGLLVGRDAGCDVLLESKEVSRRHARFFVKAGVLQVEDLGSHNGVFVQGKRIEGPSAVPAGAPVEIGDVKVAVAGGEKKANAEGVGAGAVLRGKGGRDIKLPARAVIGRVAECDVVLDDDSVSRKHAELARDERGLYKLKDLDSANGTFLNGKRLGKEAVLVPEGAKLRFGDVELVLFRPAAKTVSPEQRRKLLLYGALGLAVLLVAIGLVKSSHRAGPAQEVSDGDEAGAAADQAQAALESERFDEAARLAQAAIDKDPLAQAPRKLLAQARRELESQKAFNDALAKAQVGREDEALQFLSRVSPQSRFFARARIKAKDLAVAIQRVHGSACRTASGAREIADECARAMDVKCQQGNYDDDAMYKKLRAAEKAQARRVAWSCPPQLAALFRDDLGETAGGLDEKAFAALYPDAPVRAAMLQYARGDSNGALRALAKRGSREAVERMKVVDGRFREGQTALLGGALERADTLWGEALQADSALMPAGVESFFSRQMRTSLARAHGKSGDEKLQRGQTTTAYDEWMKGLSVSPHDPHLLDQLARLEKTAEGILAGSPSCDQLQIAAHITRADPPSPAHEQAQKGLEACK